MLKFIQNNREITALLAVVLLFVLPGFLNRQYLSVQTLTMVYSSAQILILLAMGATLVMLTRNIDVSVGSITGMCAVLLGMLLNAGYSLPVACVATLLLGLLAGFFNGVLVAWLKIPAIVATLGTLGLYRGIMLLWTGGKWIEGLPAELKQLSAPLLFGVSAIGWLTIILVAFMAWLLAKTAFGRSFYVTGDNLQGARQLGVRTEAIRIVAFSLNGCMAALAGIVFASQIGFIPNQTGTGLEMKAIAACVLGGISLLGGSGAIIGAVLGAWFLTQIDSVLVLLRIPAWWNDFIAGLVLLAVLVFDGRLRCALERNLRRQGVRTEAIRIVAFSLNGCMAALAGIVFASQIGFIPNQTGTGLEMKAIAACVLGGISLLGGSGAIIGAVLGAWFLTQIDSVLVLLRIPAWWNDFIAGLVLLAVLVFDGRLRCALERNLRRQKYARFMMPPPSVKPASSGKKREAA